MNFLTFALRDGSPPAPGQTLFFLSLSLPTHLQICLKLPRATTLYPKCKAVNFDVPFV